MFYIVQWCVTLVICLIHLCSHVNGLDILCSNFINYSETAEGKLAEFEIQHDFSSTNSIIETAVYVSDECKANKCFFKNLFSLGRTQQFYNLMKPMKYSVLFRDGSKDAKIINIFDRTSKQCRVICRGRKDETVKSQQKSMKYTFYPKGRNNAEVARCDFQTLFNQTMIDDGTDRVRICGKVSENITGQTLWKIGIVDKGTWPWQVALYGNTDLQLNFLCSGTLVSEHVVLTTARCIYRGKEFYTAKDILMFMGRYDLTDYADLNWSTYATKSITVHPQYMQLSYQNDIAILTTHNPVIYTEYIRPACLSLNLPIDDGTHNVELGKIVDWDIQQDVGNSRIPRAILTRIVQPTFLDTDEVSGSDMNIDLRSSIGSKQCDDEYNGIILTHISGEWQFRGTGLYCDANTDSKHFVLFTDIVNYIDWIKNTTLEI